ncbi:MAG: bifunctional adenosylcobinamide kinase/adenosylcobinamide-phosphate guanylyltransferase [Cyanothece sp. SIO1E1]|nr:bifunctional adenosylcobinamide kinase/adenosylcobinamide-phosphate guanylyltransferase [Cyanothece sp. SIO1E1]
MESANLQRLILITGPTRSGKSEWAETLATQSGKSVIYVATAQIDGTDLEWQARIEHHRHRRPSHWKTVEVPLALTTTIEAAGESDCLLVDSLGTWLANLLDQNQVQWQQTQQQLLNSLKRRASDVILVAEETGWGLVPTYPVGRTFRDRLGGLIRHLGAIANPVYLVTGGHVLNLSKLGMPLR